MTLRVLDLLGREHVLVFAGGGVRAFYGLGWAASLQERGIRFREIVASSSGAALSLALLSGTYEQVMYDFAAEARSHKHVDWKSWWRGDPLFTVGAAYRDMIERWLRHQRVLEHFTELAFLAWELPLRVCGRRTLEFLQLAWHLNRELADPNRHALRTHRLALKKGMTEKVFTKADMQTPRKMVDAVIASSCIPPLVEHENRGFLDGGLTLPVPAHVAAARHSDSSILVVGNGYSVVRQAQAALRHFQNHRNDIHWFYPDRLHVGMWSFDDPEGITRTYAQGYRDGRALL